MEDSAFTLQGNWEIFCTIKQVCVKVQFSLQDVCNSVKLTFGEEMKNNRLIVYFSHFSDFLMHCIVGAVCLVNVLIRRI